jgi:hypothetical protein
MSIIGNALKENRKLEYEIVGRYPNGRLIRHRTTKYYELHHILPKSLFPNWIERKSNQVLLTAREHYICHQLLTKIYVGSKMIQALWFLSNLKRSRKAIKGYCIKGSKEYEKLRSLFSKKMSETMPKIKKELRDKEELEVEENSIKIKFMNNKKLDFITINNFEDFLTYCKNLEIKRHGNMTKLLNFNYDNPMIIKRFEDYFKKTRLTSIKIIRTEFFCRIDNPRSKGFYLERGWSEEDAIQKVKDLQSKCGKQQTYNDDRLPNQIKYWIKKGFNEEESVQKVKERQQTVSKENYIKRYGEELGLQKYNDRLEKYKLSMKAAYARRSQ